MLGQGLGTIAPWSTKYPYGGVGGSNNNGRKLWSQLYNVSSNEDSEGGSQSTSSSNGTRGTLSDGDKINAWNGRDGTDLNWVQTTSADKPTYDNTEKTACKFDGNQFFDISSNISIPSDSDFAIVINFKCTNLDATRAIMGHDGNNLVSLINNKTIRAEIAGTARQFAESTNTLAVDQYYILTLVRKDDALSAYIKGGAYTTEETWGSEIATASGALTISNLGASSDDTNNFIGFIKDVIVYTTSDGGLSKASNRRALYYAIENKY
tara:strand:+ start:421 stop:1218 length:798 start_codon:yes stop_codon:yes gene_type:complete